MDHKTINSNRGIVHYWISRTDIKSRKTIVFTHGLTANHIMFEKQVDYFKDKYNIIVWDVPLHGLSRPYKNFSYKNTALELCTILDVEHIEKVVLVGMSMGGYPSQMFGHMFPQRTLGFIAIDTTPFGLKYYSKSDIWWLKKVAPMAKWFTKNMLKKSMAKSVSKTKYSYDVMMKMLEPLSKDEIIEQMDIAYGEFVNENLDINIDFPVLLLLGDQDKTGKVKQYNYMWTQNTGYPLVIINNAAHFSNGDNPKQVNEEIYKFLQEL